MFEGYFSTEGKMNSDDNINEDTLKELIQLRSEIAELRKLQFDFKRVKEELAYEHGLYKDLANALPSGMYRLRVFPNGRIKEEEWKSSKDAPYILEFINDRFCEILKLKREDFEKNPALISDLVYEDDKPGFARKNIEANKNVTPFEWEGRLLIHKEILWVHFESHPRKLENNDILWTGILYDICDRKKTEQEILLKNEELKKINIEKDKFLSIISHDLKTPFNSIMGFSDILSECIKSNDLEKIEKYTTIINRSATKAMDLLRNLIDWSLSQTGRMNYKPELFDLPDLIDEIIMSFSDIAESKTIQISRIDSSVFSVFADKAMVSTIIRNLISNAVKFTKSGGAIDIRSEQDSTSVIISVSDTGIGIPPQTISKLFRIDANVTTKGTDNESGTGLGLMLCKEFVDKHGGKIEVESEPGKGTSFKVYLPLK